MPRRELAISNQHPRLSLDRRALTRAIAVLDDTFAAGAERTKSRAPRRSCPPGELSLVFLTDEALAQLHAQFLDDPSITDVITFEGDRAAGVAGEVCVSADAALRVIGKTSLRTAADRRRFSREVMLYVVHGWLHLAGYDDLQPAKKRRMRRAEARAMRLIERSPGGVPMFGLRAGRS